MMPAGHAKESEECPGIGAAVWSMKLSQRWIAGTPSGTELF